MTTHVCEICGEEFVLGEGGEIFDGKHLCMRCLNRETTVCEHCGDRVWNDDAVHGSFCANCFDEYYTKCRKIFHHYRKNHGSRVKKKER